MPSANEHVGLGQGMFEYPRGTHRFGLFDLKLDFGSATAIVSGGPNDAVSYLTSSPTLVDTIWIHPALSPTTAYGQALSWYNDQNGFPVKTCAASQIATLRDQIRVHEGATQASASHWAHWSASLPASNLGTIFEKVFSGQQTLMASTISQAILPWQNNQQAAEQIWDNSERTRIFGLSGVLGCNLDYTLVGDGG